MFTTIFFGSINEAGAWGKKPFIEKIKNIERIHYHEGASFTYWQRVEGYKIIPICFEHKWWGYEETKIVIYDDLKPNEKMWAIERGIGNPRDQSGVVEYIEIHVHSIKEIWGGAGITVNLAVEQQQLSNKKAYKIMRLFTTKVFSLNLF